MQPGSHRDFWIVASVVTLGLGLLTLIPVWWRGRARRAGRITGFGSDDAFMRNVSCSLLLIGIVGLLSQTMGALKDGLDTGPFLLLCAVALGFIFWVAARIDASEGRRQR